MLSCNFCSKEFSKKKPDQVGRQKKYCSKPCADKMSKLKRKPKKILPVCRYCNKQFNGHINRGYCSKECKRDLRKVSYAVRDKTFKCRNCKILFTRKILSEAMYCSKDCRFKFRYKNKPPMSERSRKAQRNLRERNAPGLSQFEIKVLREKWKTDKKVCQYCLQDFDTIDHVIPLYRGGTNSIFNLVPCCRKCNSSKGSKLLSEWKPDLYACG